MSTGVRGWTQYGCPWDVLCSGHYVRGETVAEVEDKLDRDIAKCHDEYEQKRKAVSAPVSKDGHHEEATK